MYFYVYYDDNESFFDNLYNVKLAFEFTKEEFSIFKKKYEITFKEEGGFK